MELFIHAQIWISHITYDDGLITPNLILLTHWDLFSHTTYDDGLITPNLILLTHWDLFSHITYDDGLITPKLLLLTHWDLFSHTTYNDALITPNLLLLTHWDLFSHTTYDDGLITPNLLLLTHWDLFSSSTFVVEQGLSEWEKISHIVGNHYKTKHNEPVPMYWLRYTLQIYAYACFISKYEQSGGENPGQFTSLSRWRYNCQYVNLSEYNLNLIHASGFQSCIFNPIGDTRYGRLHWPIDYWVSFQWLHLGKWGASSVSARFKSGQPFHVLSEFPNHWCSWTMMAVSTILNRNNSKL